MDFESPDVEKDFPGLYASESARKSLSRDSDYSDDEKVSRKDLLGKRKEKKESKKDKGYVAFEGESSEDELDETKSPGKLKKNRSTFTFPRKDKKEKKDKAKEKDAKDKKDEEKESKISKKDPKETKKDSKKIKNKNKEEKKKKESKLLKKDKKKKASEQFSEERPIFGIPLQEAVERNKSHDGIEIPVIVRESIDYIEEHGLACEGIYRISGVKSKVRQLKCQYNRGEKVYLYEHEPHVVASLLKQFLRDLPEPILTTELIPKFEEAAAIKTEEKRIGAMLKLLESLPNCNRLLLSWIFVHMLHVVQLEKRNKMNLQNVSIVLSPAMQISHRVLHAFFTHADVLFKGVEIKKYVPPIEPDSSRLSLELPDSPTAIEDELCKQENLLNVIHAELNTGLRDTEKEEQLWEVQRVVTQLKRKLRFLRQVMDASKQPTENNVEEIKSSENVPAQQPSIQKLDVEKSINASNKSSDSESLGYPSQQGNGCAVETMNCEIVNGTYIPDISMEKVSEKENAVGKNDCQVQELEHWEKPVDSTVDSADVEKLHDISEGQKVVSPETTEVESISADEVMSLHRERVRLIIQEEELLLLGDELRRKINSERMEIERLRQEIAEYQQLYKYRVFSLDSTGNSSSDSEDDSSPSDGEENVDLVDVLKDLFRKNDFLEKLNRELSQSIQQEREACLELKVRMKMAQKESQYMHL